MGVVLKSEVKLLVPEIASAAADQPTKWVNTLTANAEIINNRRSFKISDSGKFNANVAAPAAAGFAPMIDAAFISRKGRTADEIKEANATRLGKAFSKYNRNLDLAFATVGGVTAARFKDNVANKQANWAEGVETGLLRLTGDKIRGLSVAAIAAYFLTGDQRAISMLRPGDSLIMGPAYNTSLDSHAGGFRGAVTQMITRAGIAIINSNYLAARITAMNLLLDDAANAFADIAKATVFNSAGADTYCKFIVEGGLLKLHVKTSL